MIMTLRIPILMVALLFSVATTAIPLQRDTAPAVGAVAAGAPAEPMSTPYTEIPEVARARSALAQGRWAEALDAAVLVMSRGVPDLDAVGILALTATILGRDDLRDAALSRLETDEPAPPYYGPLAHGVVDLRANRPGSARASFDAVLASHRDSHLALFLRGQAREMEQHFDGALRDYRAVLEIEPDFTPALVTLARLLSVSGQHDAAVSLIERAMRLEPGNRDIRGAAINVYDRAGHEERARATADRLLQEVPGVRQIEADLAWRLLRDGHPEDAAAKLEEVVKRFGDAPADALLRAMLAADLGREAEIGPHLQRYLRAAGNDADSRRAASLVYLSLGRGEDALRTLGPAEDDGASTTKTATYRAVALQLAGDVEKGRAILQRLGADEASPTLALLRANLCASAGDPRAYSTAMQDVDTWLPGAGSAPLPAGLQLDPKKRAQWAAWRNAAVLMLENRWSIPLERLAVKALSVVARDQLALHMQGVALMARGETEASVGVLRRSVELAPDFLGARLDLAAALLQLSDKTAASEVLNASAALAERGPALLQLGLLQQQAGDGTRARASVRRALQTDDRGAWRTQAEGFLAGAVETPR